MQIQKNETYIVDIIDNGFEGEGIAKIDNFAIFIPNAIKGEKIKVLIIKVNKNFAYGKIVQVLKRSDSRNIEIDCNTYSRCGGCNLRHMNYKTTLELKRNVVLNCLKKELKRDIKVEDTIGMENNLYYRNKLQYPVGLDKEGKPLMGVYATRTHEIVPTDNCYIQDKDSQKIADDVFKFIKDNNIEPYNEKTGKGLVRHIIVKKGKATNEAMLVLVLNSKKFTQETVLVKCITEKYKNIKTVIKNINNKNTNVILGEENIVLYGNGYIQDYLGEYKFNISPLAFYQVNPIQTEKLYNKAIELANLSGRETIYDLYCGIGTISIFLAKYAKKVYGIEIVEDAIKDAKQNAINNMAENIEFFAGDVEEILPSIIKKDKADVVFVDPPRKGLDENTVNNILKIEPEKMVYISCNPATLGRDLKIFEEKYNIEIVQPVDMFPWTSHVEAVVLLIKIQ